MKVLLRGMCWRHCLNAVLPEANYTTSLLRGPGVSEGTSPEPPELASDLDSLRDGLAPLEMQCSESSKLGEEQLCLLLTIFFPHIVSFMDVQLTHHNPSPPSRRIDLEALFLQNTVQWEEWL